MSALGSLSTAGPARWRRPPAGSTEEHGRGPEARALLAALRTGPAPIAGPRLGQLVAACDPAQLVGTVLAEGLAGPAHERLGHLLPPAERARLAREAARDGARHQAYLQLLGRLGAALDGAGLTWVVLKGPVLAELSYRGTPRGYTDLDLLVPAHQFRAAVEALREAGAAPADQDWAQLVRVAKGEMNVAVHGAPMVDLHWHLVYLRSARERWAVPTDDLLGRRRRTRLGAVDAWALDREDFAAHLALHAASGAVQQLRRLLDVQRSTAHEPPDWEVLVRRCRAWRVGLPVSVMLHRAARALGAAVPEEVVSELAGGPLNRALVRRLGEWVPAGRLPGQRSVSNGLTRCLRDGLWSTGAEFAAGSAQALAELLRLPSGSGAGRPAVPPGPGGLEGYLAMVERSDRYGHLGRR